jgi:hypothetical protein
MAQAARKEPSEYNNAHYIIGSLLLRVIPLHMSQKKIRLHETQCISSKLSEISGLSLLCATLGYHPCFIFGLS